MQRWQLFQELSLEQQFYPALELYNKYNPPVKILMLQIPDIFDLSQSLPDFTASAGPEYHNTVHNYYINGSFKIERNPNKIIPNVGSFKITKVLNQNDTNLLKKGMVEVLVTPDNAENYHFLFYHWDRNYDPPKPPRSGWTEFTHPLSTESLDRVFVSVPNTCRNLAVVVATGITEIHIVIIKARDSIIFESNKEFTFEVSFLY